MTSQINAYNNTTSSLEPATYAVPNKPPAESAELSRVGLPQGSHRYIVGENANPAALADKVVGTNPRLQGAQSHIIAYLAKHYGALKPGMVVELPPSERIIGHQGPAALQRAAKAYEALKQLEHENGTTKLSPNDQTRMDAEMESIRDARAQTRPSASKVACVPRHTDSVVRPRFSAAEHSVTTRAALAPPMTPGFKVTQPTLFSRG